MPIQSKIGEYKLIDYQLNALETWGEDTGWLPPELCCGLGISGEAGEVSDLIKKEYYHGHPRNPEKVLEELGDTLYYLSVAAWYYGYTLEEVARANNEKLSKRYPNGFESERSINRG